MNLLSKAIHTLDKVGVFSRWCSTVGVITLFLTTCLTFVDVILRYVFNRPIRGAWELTGVMMVVVVFLGIAYVQNQKGHVAMDLVTDLLSPTPRIVMDTAIILLSIGLFVILIWRNFVHVLRFLQIGAVVSPDLPIPSAPFVAIIVLGCTLLCLLLLRDLLRNVAEALRLGLKWYHWLLMSSGTILFIVLAILWMQPMLWQPSLLTVGLIGTVFSILFFLTGMPISFVLILSGFLFVGHISGSYIALDMVGVQIYRSISNYLWATVAFFVLMGYFVLYSKFGEDMYFAAYRWIGRLRGGLAMATVAASAAMSATVGDIVSVTATMTAVSLPEMRKYKYDDHLSAGCICAGGTLGPIIPPSVVFIIYGLLTQLSIGKLFVAGIIPGLLLAFFFCLTIYIWCRSKPDLGPPGESFKWGQRLVSLKAGGPVLILFLLVIGGLYFGIFAPVEGGAIGAIGTVILGLLYRRFTWKNFTQSLLEAGKVIAMVFLIVVSAQMFTVFAVRCNLSDALRQALTGLSLSPFWDVVIIELVLFILGFVIDTMPLMLICVPVMHPVIVALGVDPIWFAILTCIVLNIGVITPPVGLVLFTLKGMAKDIPYKTISWGVLPFAGASVAAVGILFVVPSLVTWLPNLLR